MIKPYYQLAKPGIVYGNLLTAIAGFFFAAQGPVSWPLFFGMALGLSLVIGSAASVNNYLDRDIDARMERTKNRTLVLGVISPRNALVFAACLGVLGVATLSVFTNLLTLAVAIFGWFAYIAIYTPAKRRTHYATHLGALSGAVPPVVGYTAVTGGLDATAVLLFLILCFWQMAHFYAIALYRKSDYANARIPTLPVARGVPRTKIEIALYIVAFAFAVLALPFIHPVNFLYPGALAALSVGWFTFALTGFWAADDAQFGRAMLRASLIVLLIFSLALIIS